MRKNDRVCVPRYYPINHIKPNRMYIVRYCNSLFIANGNIYMQTRKYDDEKCYCCTIRNFKKWGSVENLKKFVSLKGKKKAKTIADLMDAVIECGYNRELDYFEYRDIENDCLIENSDYRYSINKLVFQDYPEFNRGFSMNGTGFRESEGRIFHDGDMNFSLDLSDMNGGIRKDLPECILKEIKCEANKLLEANLVKSENIGQAVFACYANARFNHCRCAKNRNHYFYRSYSIHIEINKISDYYNDFDLDSMDMKFLKHADFCLCDRSWTEKPFDEFIKNEIFHF